MKHIALAIYGLAAVCVLGVSAPASAQGQNPEGSIPSTIYATASPDRPVRFQSN